MMTKHSWTDGEDLPTTRLSVDLRRGDVENNGGVTRLAKKLNKLLRFKANIKSWNQPSLFNKDFV